MPMATRSRAIVRGPERGFAPMVGSRQILSHSTAAVRTRSFAASNFVGLAGSSLPNQGASGDSYEFSALDVEHAADLPRRHGLTSQDDGQQERSRPDDFSHGHTGATSPASGSARLTGGSHTRPANSSLAAHGCYRVIGPARICKRGDTLVAHLFPGARLELLDRDGKATALLLLQQQAAAAVQPQQQTLTDTDVTAALPMSYGGGSSTAVGSMGFASGSGDSTCWSAGASLFSIVDDEDVPPPLPAAAAEPAPAPAPMASSPAAATAAAAPPLMSSGVGGGIGGGSSAGGGAFPAAAGSPQQAEAEAQRVVEECVLVAAHVELGGSASSVDLVDIGLQPALHRLNGHTYLSVRCLPPCAQFELGPNAHLCHPINMTPPADTCC